MNPKSLSKKLNKNRSYAFDSRSLDNKKTMNNCMKFFKDYGFCLLDNIIPSNKIEIIRQEILNAQLKSSQNIKEIKKLLKNKRIDENKLLNSKKVFLRSVGRE